MFSVSVMQPRRHRGRGTRKLEGELNYKVLATKYYLQVYRVVLLVNAGMTARNPVKEASSGAERRVVVDGGKGQIK